MPGEPQDVDQLIEDLRGPIAKALRDAGFFELAPIAERAADALADKPMMLGFSPVRRFAYPETSHLEVMADLCRIPDNETFLTELRMLGLIDDNLVAIPSVSSRVKLPL